MSSATSRRAPVLALAVAGLAILAFAGTNDGSAADLVRNVAKVTSPGPKRMAHRGLRKIEYRDEAGKGQSYVEKVFSDGGDDLGIDLASVGSGDPSPEQSLLHKRHARFFHTFRDCSVDGADRLLKNYDADLMSEEDLAGRRARHLRLTPKATAAQRVDLWVDQETGYPLRVDRFGDDGHLIFRMSYDRIEYGPISRSESDPATLPPSAPKSPGGVGDLGFEPLAPSDIPKGFDRAGSDVVELEANGTKSAALRERFTDGLEHVFVLQGDLRSGFWGDSIPTPSADMLRVGVYQIGSVSLVTTTVDGRALVAIGRLPAQVLAEFLASFH